MAVNLLDMISSAISPGLMQTIAKSLGENETAVQSGISALVPTLLGGLASKAAAPGGAANVLSMLTGSNVDTSLLSTMGSLLTSGQSTNLMSVGRTLLSGLFGADKASGLGSALAGITGLKSSSAGNLAALAVPLVFSFLKKFIGDQRLSAGGLASLLTGQKEHLSGKLDPALTSALGLGSPANLLAGLTPAAATAAVSTAASTGLPSWLPWLIGLPLLGLLLWYVFGKKPAPPVAPAAPVTIAPPAPAAAPAPAATATPAPAATAAAAASAKVYFETGKADIGAEGKSAIASVAAADKGSTRKFEVTGYTDRSGDTAANQELAKNRALAVKAALVAAGIGEDRIETKPPVFVEVGAGTTDAEARRVDITVR